MMNDFLSGWETFVLQAFENWAINLSVEWYHQTLALDFTWKMCAQRIGWFVVSIMKNTWTHIAKRSFQGGCEWDGKGDRRGLRRGVDECEWEGRWWVRSGGALRYPRFNTSLYKPFCHEKYITMKKDNVPFKVLSSKGSTRGRIRTPSNIESNLSYTNFFGSIINI